MLTRRQLAARLNLAEHTLAVWAVKGTGPKFLKVGRAVRYRWSDVEAWLEAQTCGGAA